MPRDIFCACLALVLASACCAAQSDQSPHFEAASIESAAGPATGPRMFSGGGGPATFEGTTTLEELINEAYDLGFGKVAGPSWIYTDRWAISAKLPSGTTGEQFRQMLANLLAERLGLVVHRVKKEVMGYELTVAPGGPKLTPSKAEAAAIVSSTGSGRPGMSWDSQKDGDMTRMTFRRTSMAFLEHQVSSLLSGSGPGETIPVIDRTGLTGHFDFDIEIPQWGKSREVTTGRDAGVDLSSALEKQLGLRLSPVKAQLNYMVVDHVNKAPRDN